MKIRVAILVVSDGVSRGTREDKSGKAIAAWAQHSGHAVAEQATVSDEEDEITAQMEQWIELGGMDVILTTGGTGFSSRDVTPEATWSVIEREAPGIAEAIRADARPKTPNAVLSRGIAGIVQQILVVNLPGSVAGVTDALQVIDTFLPHAVQILHDQTEH